MVAYVLCDWNQMHAGHTEELLKGKLPELALSFMTRRGEAGLLLRIKHSNRIKASGPLPLETVSKASVFLSSSPISSLVISQTSPCKGSCLSWCFSAWCDLTEAGIWLNCYPRKDFFNYYIYLVENTCACGNQRATEESAVSWRSWGSNQGPQARQWLLYLLSLSPTPRKGFKACTQTRSARCQHCTFPRETLGRFLFSPNKKNRPSEV